VRLTGCSFKARSDTSPAQREGEKSGAVLRTERLLRSLRLDTGKVDGHFTAATTKAVKTFQRRHDLAVTGEVNGRTLEALKQGANRIVKPPMVWKPSPNQSSRGGVDVDALIIHHTASNNTAADLATLRSPAAGVSAHYLVGRDGKIYQLVKDERRAWHAGVAAIRGDSSPDVNSRSIGIEITNAGDGKTPFTQKQYAALEKLVPYLMKKHKIPMKNLLGHKDVALPAGRKSDPAPNFNWERIRRAARRAVA
jgi:N-acetylmuramoyl-L-alanine amidase